MKMFLIRHGKSDKSLKNVLPHNEFELERTLIVGEEQKASQLGEALKNQLSGSSKYDFVWSGKKHSKQTVLAVANGLGFSDEEAHNSLREDFGLIYLAEQEYWEAAEEAIKNRTFPSHADYFLNNPSTSVQTFTAPYMQQNMKSVLRRTVERNTFLGNGASFLVSHEPVLSLCRCDLTGKSVNELGGSFEELEYAVFTIADQNQPTSVQLDFRGDTYEVGLKLFPS